MSIFRNGVFISYAHEDRQWLELLKKHLTPIVRTEGLDVWDDTRIGAGDDWRREIVTSLQQARSAVVLVTPDLLASPFVNDVELPLMVEQVAAGLTVLWVPVRPAAWDRTPLPRFQALIDPSKPLAALPPVQLDAAMVRVAERIGAATTLNAVANSFEVIDRVASDFEAFVEGQPEPDRAARREIMSMREQTRIRLEDSGGVEVEEITYEELMRLDDNAQMLIRGYERTMQDLFERWVELKPRRRSQDDGIRAKARAESEGVRRDLCGELTELLLFVERLGKYLNDHYQHIHHICGQPASP